MFALNRKHLFGPRVSMHRSPSLRFQHCTTHTLKPSRARFISLAYANLTNGELDFQVSFMYQKYSKSKTDGKVVEKRELSWRNSKVYCNLNNSVHTLSVGDYKLLVVVRLSNVNRYSLVRKFSHRPKKLSDTLTLVVCNLLYWILSTR
jgi:hypothetical protein